MDYSTYSPGFAIGLHHSKNSYGNPKFEAADYAFTGSEFFKINIHGLFYHLHRISESIVFFWE